jgi:hypothetical protein
VVRVWGEAGSKWDVSVAGGRILRAGLIALRGSK